MSKSKSRSNGKFGPESQGFRYDFSVEELTQINEWILSHEPDLGLIFDYIAEKDVKVSIKGASEGRYSTVSISDHDPESPTYKRYIWYYVSDVYRGAASLCFLLEFGLFPSILEPTKASRAQI